MTKTEISSLSVRNYEHRRQSKLSKRTSCAEAELLHPPPSALSYSTLAHQPLCLPHSPLLFVINPFQVNPAALDSSSVGPQDSEVMGEWGKS